MMYEPLLRTEEGRLRLPFADLPMLLHVHGLQMGKDERPALENMTQFVITMAILAGRLRECLSQYEETTWVNVPFHLMFVDTQSVVLDRKSTRLNSSHIQKSRMPSSA